jgi:Fur family ferric uptake transcriptional regulator
VEGSEQTQAALVANVFGGLGIPFTRQRRAVWEYFAACGRAATVAEAAEALKPQGIGQATVYRAVGLLSELGLLVRVHTREGEACYTASRVGHRHPLICRVCRKVVDFDGGGDLTYLEKQLEAATGFRIFGHHLEVYGICPDCAESAGDGAGRP